MPDGAASARAEQLAEMQVVIHGLKAAPEIGELIGKAERRGDLDDWQRANLVDVAPMNKGSRRTGAWLLPFLRLFGL